MSVDTVQKELEEETEPVMEEIYRLLLLFAFATAMQRIAILVDLNRKIEELKTVFSSWRQSVVDGEVGRDNARLVKSIQRAGGEVPAAAPSLQAITRSERYLNNVVTGVQNHVTMMSLSPDLTAAFPDLKLVDLTETDLKKRLEKFFKEKTVRVVGKGGKVRHFKTDYYISLVANSTIARAKRQLAIEKVRQSDGDLIQVVGPPSKHQECQIEIGKIYSVSGSSIRYPPIWEINSAFGHPFCRHTFAPYYELVTNDKS